MKYFAIATLLAACVLIAADLFAEETIPWHWDDEDVMSVDQKQSEKAPKQQDESVEWHSDLGW